MKLKSFKYFYCLLIALLYLTSVKGEEKIDIWKNKSKKQVIQNENLNNDKDFQELNLENIKTIELNQNIEIEDSSLANSTKEIKVFGIYEIRNWPRHSEEVNHK